MKKDKLIQDLINLAGEAIFLAEEYSGGESETAQELTKMLEKLVRKADKLNEE